MDMVFGIGRNFLQFSVVFGILYSWQFVVDSHLFLEVLCMAHTGSMRMLRCRWRMVATGFLYGCLVSALVLCVLVTVVFYRRWQSECLARGQPDDSLVHSLGIPSQAFLDRDFAVPDTDASFLDLDGLGVSDGEVNDLRVSGSKFLVSSDDASLSVLVGPETLSMAEDTFTNGVCPDGWSVIYSEFGSRVFTRCQVVPERIFATVRGDARTFLTGTVSMRDSVLAVADQVTEYVRRTGNHVVWKSEVWQDPDFLLPFGVILSVRSLEDDQIRVHRLFLNRESGYAIDYEASACVPDSSQSLNVCD